MAEMKMAVSAPQENGAKRGPMSMKNVDHIRLYPAFGGKVKIEHHFNMNGAYREPESKQMAPEAAAKHIAGFLGHAKEEPGGEPGEEGEKEPMSKPGRAEADEEGEE
jgi:hypothetical protein